MSSRFWKFSLPLLFFGGILIWVVLNGMRWHSPSETARNNHYRADWQGGEFGRDSSREMGVPSLIPTSKGGLFIEWTGETAIGKSEAIYDDQYQAALVDDDQIDLVAFATWYPAAEDKVSENGEADLRFWNPENLEEIPVAELVREGMDPSWGTMPIPLKQVGYPSWPEQAGSGHYRGPRIRLVFRAVKMERPEVWWANVGDAFTKHELSDPFRNGGNSTGSKENWSYADTALLCWHNTPLDIFAVFRTGDVIERILPREVGAQRQFKSHLRVQYLGEIKEPAQQLRKLSEKELQTQQTTLGSSAPTPPPAFLLPAPQGQDSPTHTLLRVNSPNRSLELGLKTNDKWNWNLSAGSGGLFRNAQAQLIKVPEDHQGPLHLGLLPHVAEISFHIAGIPQAPNQERPKDLFDLKIPRFTIDASSPRSVENLFTLYLSESVQLRVEDEVCLGQYWAELPPSWPEDGSFRNTTPRELMKWYQRATPGARISIDQEYMTLNFHSEPESLWKRIKRRLPKWARP